MVTSAVPGAQEAEAGGSLELSSARPAGSTQETPSLKKKNGIKQNVTAFSTTF
jgi:hypothetical protein